MRTSPDILLATMVRSAIFDIAPLAGPSGRPATRFGSSKVFISALWDHMRECDHYLIRDRDLQWFKTWLLEGMRMVDDTGDPLVSLARADLVGAMDSAAVQRSEIRDRGATFHFVLDPSADGV